MKPNVIVLNGTSSSGKSSIARAIQKTAGEPCVHASLDLFVDLFLWETIQDHEQRRRCHAFGVTLFHRTLSSIVAGPYLVVIDHVFEQQEWFDDCILALQNSNRFLVGVQCPLEVAEERERKRSDRRKGLARSQFDIVHASKPYDLVIDTSILTPEDCATKILNVRPDR
jgi:chloramphenicol 3-O phosphotransferase